MSPNINSLSQINSQVEEAIALCSASALDFTTCFLLFHEIKISPIKIQYPEVDLLSVGKHAQSIHQNIPKCKYDPLPPYSKPFPIAPLTLIYFIIQIMHFSNGLLEEVYMTQPQDFEANDTSLTYIVHTSQSNLWDQISP